MNASYSRVVAWVLAALTTLFVVDMFLAWQHVAVGMASVVSVDTTSTGWVGWGWVAGITALGLLMYSLLEIAGYIPEETGSEIPSAVMGVVLFVTSFAAFHNADTVNVMNMVGVERRWPATAGLVLAAAIALTAVARLVLRGPAFTHRAHPAH